MRLALVAAVIAVAGPAKAGADLAGDVSLGGGTDSSADAAAFGTTHASVTAELWRAAAPIDERLHLTDDDGKGLMWVFTGIDPDDRNGIGVSADATARFQSEGEVDDGLLVSTRAWARGAGWQLEGRAAYQPVGDLRDVIWRSGRAALQTNVALDIPPMWAIGTRAAQLAAASWRIDLGTRREREGDGWRRDGFDRDVSLTGVMLQSRRVRAALFVGRYFERGVPERTVDGTTYGTSAGGILIDLGTIAVRPVSTLDISARGGMSTLDPIAPFVLRGNSERSTGPFSFTPSYWFEIGHGALDAAGGHRVTLGAGTWDRLDPTGHAVDSGRMIAGSIAWRRDRLDARGELQLGRLERIVVGDMAPPDLLPMGTRFVMGRGALEVGVRLDHQLALTGGVWIERSDRDDPRWRVPATGAVATHAGAELTARWQFSR